MPRATRVASSRYSVVRGSARRWASSAWLMPLAAAPTASEGALAVEVPFDGRRVAVLAVAPGDPGTSDVPAPASALLLATGLALLRQRR